MTIQRISTYAIHQSTLGDVGRVQRNLADLQGQISSGKKTDRFQGLGGKVEHFVQLEAKIAKAENYIENNNMILSRVNTTRVAMENIIGVVDDMEDLLTLRRSSSSGESLQFRQQMMALRDQMRELMNMNFDGRYLFGGTNTATPPVVEDPTTSTPGVPDAAYYRGSSEDVFARLDENIEMNYGVRADDEAFQKVIAAVSQALQVGDTGSEPVLDDAYDLLQEGLQDLISVQTKVNANIVAIENTNVRHQELQLYWQGVKDNLINTDLVSASTQVAIDQTVLQAAFQSFATINSLRLVDFLR